MSADVTRCDASQRLVEREVPIEIDLLARQVRHPARRVLEAQHQAALEVILRALQFVIRNRRALQDAELLDRQVDHFLDRVRRAARVDGQVAGVAIRAHAAEHGVGKTTLLAHVLKEPRAHGAAEHRVEDVADVAVVVVLLITVGAETDVALFELLGPHENRRRNGRRPLRAALARSAQRAERAVDQLAHAPVFEIAGRRDDHVRRDVRAVEILAQRARR